MNESTGRHLRLVHSTEDSDSDATDRIRGFYTEFTTEDITLEMIFDHLRQRGELHITDRLPYEMTGIIIVEDGREVDFRIVLKEEKRRAETEPVANSKHINVKRATRVVIAIVLAGVSYGTYRVVSDNLSEPATMDQPAKPVPHAKKVETDYVTLPKEKPKADPDNTSTSDDELLEDMWSFEDDYQAF